MENVDVKEEIKDMNAVHLPTEVGDNVDNSKIETLPLCEKNIFVNVVDKESNDSDNLLLHGENVYVAEELDELIVNKKTFKKQDLAIKGDIVRVIKALPPPVKNRDERKLLNGYDCKECADYYSSFGLSQEQLREKLNKCSRHRSQYSPPKTPPHFWDIDYFPSSPDFKENKRVKND
ncbi:uncharacterized protein B4U80_11174 [Leptotrombidium deliense]|uniref:DNA endonuclease activator Ctp1 C-terminal domain-containing protein n=1 Tax=Leptotrombidium deliense TaxID=299467 RepID=A0A443SM57_9ACAR|nr:uncharacterized protein B4U80_11174 [Leptotrombidium deliense]